MEAKEKARELVEKFQNTDRCVEHYAVELDGNICSHLAKQCALIAVEEICKITPSVYVTKDEEIDSSHLQYWQQVKTEIQKL